MSKQQPMQEPMDYITPEEWIDAHNKEQEHKNVELAQPPQPAQPA